MLNYGHTLAHALEIATGHAVTHGEAVGIGLVYAAELAAALGRIDADRVAAHRAVVGGTYGLPTTIPAGVDDEQLLALMGRDKKARDGLTFVLDGPRGVEVVAPVDRDAAPRRAGSGALSRLGTVGRVQPDLPASDFVGRVAAVRAALDGRTMVLSHATNIRWLTGFGGSLAWVVIDRERLVFVTDGRYRDRAAADLAANGLDAAASAPSWRCARSGRSWSTRWSPLQRSSEARCSPRPSISATRRGPRWPSASPLEPAGRHRRAAPAHARTPASWPGWPAPRRSPTTRWRPSCRCWPSGRPRPTSATSWSTACAEPGPTVRATTRSWPAGRSSPPGRTTRRPGARSSRATP